MFSVVAIVVGLSIYVSQIRQSKFTSEWNCHESNSSFQSKLSALNSNLSVFKRMHSDLRHQFTEMETKYRSVSETKAQICDFWTSRREQTCSKDWVTNRNRCYYVSTFETSFPRAMQGCSNRDSRLLEINSRDEASFVLRSLVRRNLDYWIGQCEAGNDVHGLLYKVSPGRSSCSECKSSGGSDYCLHDKHHFICEKSAPCCPDIPEKIQLLCQQTGEPT
ncbi:killer cell lectin-like receptor subfamily B member 1B allele B isoform X2 [Hemitrygon akajei]|uniref:killer cell lectin-like receptor subfamily B member 1B allele B isoform X2 n=1 Tax=Hemitrygon akajei TaxID=2704970 RepID=UPI003BF9FD21